MRSTNHNEGGEQGRNPHLVEPLMSSKEVTSAAPESIFPKSSIFLSDSSSKKFSNTNPVQFQDVTLRINEQERSPSFASGALNSFSNEDVSTNNAVVPAHHSSCIIESSMEEQHVSRQEDLETPKSTFDDDAPRVLNCCCQVLREQLAVEVMRRLSMELAMQKMEEEVDKIRSTEGKMKEPHVTEKGKENNNEILKNVGNGDEQEKKDLKEEVMKLKCILKTRDKEIEMKKLRIAFLQDELVSHMLERDIDDNKRRISSRRRVRIPSISTDSTFKSRRIRTPTRSFPGTMSAVNLSQSSLALPSPCTRSPLKNSSTSFIVHTPNSSLCSETRLTKSLRQKASMDRLSTPSRGASSSFKNASFFAYKPCASRIYSSNERLNPHSAAFNLSSSACEAQGFMTYTTQIQSSRQSQAQLNAFRSAIRPFSSNKRKESPLRSSGNTGGDCKKKSSPSGVAPPSGSRNVNPTCDSAFHLSGTESRKATPLRSHPASRPNAAHATSRRTRRSPSFTNGPTFTTTAAAYKEESLRAKPSCCYLRKNERTKLSEGAADVCRHHDELIAPLPPPLSPLKSTPLRQTISRSVLSIENRRLNLSSKRGINDANIIKGTTTTVTFGESKKNKDEQQRLTPRSISFDASYDSVVGFHLEETDTKEGEEKLSGSVFRDSSPLRERR